MAASSALLDAGYALGAAALFALVARRLTGRHVGAASRLALSMFGAWWYGVAFFLAAGAALSLLEWRGVEDPPLFFALAAMSMLSVCVAVWGLVYYVSYLYTGRTTGFVPWVLFYAGIFAVMVYAIAQDAGEVHAWRQSVVRLAILTGPLLTAAIVAFLLPAIAALGAYARLYRRVDSRAQRFRIALATASLLAWFGLALVARALGFADSPAWTSAGRLLALAAATGVLVAYVPPTWLRRRLHLATDAVA